MSLLLSLQLLLGAGAVYFVVMLCIDLLKNKNNLGKENPIVAFPIMMASCAGLMAIGSQSFIKEGKYTRIGSIMITIGGLLGVWVAFKFVTNLNLEILTWVIIVVVIFTGFSMLNKGYKKAA
ncbi:MULTISPECIES: hypothetical protein [unclassified Gemella]|uniref:hypothetical protein n=1 Tax=unclassified Gemella TaxID=2624949 RepID=UPI001C0534F3|nr:MULTISPECIES: hypothetical protein [unclassified Gemella]MBU0279256.1 hypothetical protein [Gemella sp. zg-1178]QWQ38761.1 hypothetical protein KMP11_07425 [Gemella sp. zg-570]